jgi:alpha-1,2-rhamnosyltransferase
MFNDISDSGLQYAYDHARALVFASHDEGFGLPLVEAMQRGLPVMGSDIPVFHEIGSEYIAYFDLQRPQSLVDLIFEYDRSADFPAPRRISEWRWHNWSEASRQLVHAVLIQGNDNQELRSDCNQCELH